MQRERQKAKDAVKQDSMERLMRDMKMSVPLGKQPAKSGAPKTKKTPKELLEELEEQERQEDEEAAERGWQDDEGVEIDREDHDMYKNLRREHDKRSGTLGTSETATQPKSAIEDDGMGGRWPAPR